MGWRVLVGGDNVDEKAFIQAGMTAGMLSEMQKQRTTCKKCEKITKGDLYPYQRTMFGRVKNYVCKECAEDLGLAWID